MTTTERNEYIDRLHNEWMVGAGDTIFTILRHVSGSGMSRTISLVHMPEGWCDSWGAQRVLELDYVVSKITGHKIDQRRGCGLKISGCGMDMGFKLVYQLSSCIYPNGFDCIGEHCPSNDHSNGDPRSLFNDDGTTRHHRDGGYALRQKWL